MQQNQQQVESSANQRQPDGVNQPHNDQNNNYYTQPSFQKIDQLIEGSQESTTPQLYKHFLITSDDQNSGKTAVSAYLASMLSYNNIQINYIKLSPALSTQINLLAPDISGECFVTADGGQVDMDCGIIERSITQHLTKKSCLTLGTAIEEVNLKELQNKTCCFEFLNIDKNLVNWISQYLKEQMDDKVTIIEIGGGINDIGGMIFDRSVQKLVTQGYEVMNIHLGKQEQAQRKCDIYINETLHVEEFRHRQITPDVQQVLDQKLAHADLFYTYLHNRYEKESKEVNIALVGRYISSENAYLSIIQTIRAAAHKLHINVNLVYLQSLYINESNIEENMKGMDGLVIPGGFGNVGQEGLICAIKYARTHKLPMIAICLGFQMTCIEFARDVCLLEDCDSFEMNEYCKNPIIHQLSVIQSLIKQSPQQDSINNSSMTQGKSDLKINLVKETPYSFIFDQKTERFWHSYAFNMKYYDTIVEKGLKPVVFDYKHNVMMAVYVEDHPFFLATQFHPEFKSRFNQPHKMYVEFMRAVLQVKEGQKTIPQEFLENNKQQPKSQQMFYQNQQQNQFCGLQL